MGLTRTQQETAIRRLTQSGVIDYKRAQVPARKHFRVNMQRLQDVLPSLKEINKLNYPNPPRRNAETLQSITEITQKTKTQNTGRALDRASFMLERKRLIADKSVTAGRRNGYRAGMQTRHVHLAIFVYLFMLCGAGV